MNTKTSYLPTRKWAVNVGALFTGLFLMWVTTGEWNQEESVSLITLLSTAFATYMIPNDPSNTNSP